MTDKTDKALLVVSFGTSYPETRERTIDAIERDLATAFPDRMLYRAWTSGFIIKKLRKRGEEAPHTLHEALRAMAADGVHNVLVQPTHITPGFEHQLIDQAFEEFEGCFDTVAYGAPLLADDEDTQLVAQALADEFPREEGQLIALMGHGAPDGPNHLYVEIERALADRGRDDVCIALVEGTPDVEHVLDRARREKPARALLAPLMIVAGDHANNDLAGDENDSWKSLIEALGIPTRCRLAGLGEYPAIRSLFVEHACTALSNARRKQIES